MLHLWRNAFSECLRQLGENLNLIERFTGNALKPVFTSSQVKTAQSAWQKHDKGLFFSEMFDRCFGHEEQTANRAEEKKHRDTPGDLIDKLDYILKPGIALKPLSLKISTSKNASGSVPLFLDGAFRWERKAVVALGRHVLCYQKHRSRLTKA